MRQKSRNLQEGRIKGGGESKGQLSNPSNQAIGKKKEGKNGECSEPAPLQTRGGEGEDDEVCIAILRSCCPKAAEKNTSVRWERSSVSREHLEKRGKKKKGRQFSERQKARRKKEIISSVQRARGPPKKKPQEKKEVFPDPACH